MHVTGPPFRLTEAMGLAGLLADWSEAGDPTTSGTAPVCRHQRYEHATKAREPRCAGTSKCKMMRWLPVPQLLVIVSAAGKQWTRKFKSIISSGKLSVLAGGHRSSTHLRQGQQFGLHGLVALSHIFQSWLGTKGRNV